MLSCNTQLVINKERWGLFTHRIAVATSWGTLLVPTLLFRSTRPRSLSSGNLSRAALTLLTYLHISDDVSTVQHSILLPGNIHHV